MSLSVTWSVTGINEAIAKCQQIITKVNSYPAEVFQTVGHQMVSACQAQAPVRTGYLRDHIVLVQQNAQQFSIISQAPYSAFVEFGTYKMAPREFFFSVIEGFIPEITQMISNNILT